MSDCDEGYSSNVSPCSLFFLLRKSGSELGDNFIQMLAGENVADLYF